MLPLKVGAAGASLAAGAGPPLREPPVSYGQKSRLRGCHYAEARWDGKPSDDNKKLLC